MVAQLIANSTDRECRFLQADMLMEEDRIEEAEEIFKQLVMDEEYEVDTLLDIIQDYTNANQEEYAGQWVDCLFAHSDMQTLPKPTNASAMCCAIITARSTSPTWPSPT